MDEGVVSPGPYLILESQGGGHVPLSEFTNLGRAEDNLVVLDDIGVSTYHAVIRKDGAFWVIEDLGSTNGTWLNRQRVEAPTVIKEGDQLQMGSMRMRVSGFRTGVDRRSHASDPAGTCPRCFKGLPPQAVFCPSCGLPVLAPPTVQNKLDPTVPFRVPFPDSPPPAPAKDSNRNALLLGCAILGGLALVASAVLGWMLREKVSTRNAPRGSINFIQQPQQAIENGQGMGRAAGDVEIHRQV